MAKERAIYKSYLLRVWRDEENGRQRLRLEDVSAAGQTHYFADIDDFIGYLLSTPPFDANRDQQGGGMD